MSERANPLRRAAATKGWWRAQRYLLLRRFSQLAILGLFLLGPLAGIWIVEGNLASSRTLDILELTDPYVFVQSLAAGYWPLVSATVGALIVAIFYLLVGGRAYCSWVCPVNIVTDAAAWGRWRLGLRGGARLKRHTRYWMLGMTLIAAFLSGSLLWELINPVSLLHRGLIFGLGLAWVVILTVFLFDLVVSPRGWCSHLCPMGAFYGLLGTGSVLRVRANDRQSCDDCGDCYLICPEPQVIAPALKGSDGHGPTILASACTNCGRCIDICHAGVFRFGSRFNSRQNDNTSH